MEVEPESDALAASGDTADPGFDRVEAIRDRVLNVIGHELRTPVSTLRGLAEAALTAGQPGLDDEVLPALVRNARRLEDLVNEMLIASGVTTAIPTGATAPVALDELAREVWYAVRGTAGEGSAARELRIEGRATARMEPSGLRMVLERVLDNAIKYGDDDPLLQVDERDGRAFVTVTTNGPELHPEEVALATEAFFRGEHAVMTTPGLGLGLAVAREVVEHAGGRLWVEAAPGGGLITCVDLAAA